MKLRQRICARWGTVQHQTKAFYFVALKFAGFPDHHILTDSGWPRNAVSKCPLVFNKFLISVICFSRTLALPRHVSMAHAWLTRTGELWRVNVLKSTKEKLAKQGFTVSHAGLSKQASSATRFITGYFLWDITRL
jgi:hypothetical protein